jgi:hypothetical protein
MDVDCADLGRLLELLRVAREINWGEPLRVEQLMILALEPGDEGPDCLDVAAARQQRTFLIGQHVRPLGDQSQDRQA